MVFLEPLLNASNLALLKESVCYFFTYDATFPHGEIFVLSMTSSRGLGLGTDAIDVYKIDFIGIELSVKKNTNSACFPVCVLIAIALPSGDTDRK